MDFSINDLKQEQLNYLGITKKDILDLPPRNYNALFSGRRTSLIRFNNLKIPGLDTLDAKLSLRKEPDGTTSLLLHPIRKVPDNIFELNQSETKRLNEKEGAWVTKTVKDKEGKEVPYMVTLDRETNEYVGLRKETIHAPDRINGVALNENQKKDFTDGNEIDLEGEKFRLSPNEIGIAGKNGTTNFKSAEFKDIKYSRNELLLDIAILVSGAAPWFLIGGVALTIMKGLMAHTSGRSIPGHSGYTNLNENELKTAVKNSRPQIEQLIKSDKKNLHPEDFSSIFKNAEKQEHTGKMHR